ncbi:carbohydrate ABC transporter permease [Treponema primitia]|uniref:carbohydrate ABC transporter permease n=1 Tax=Treponema primitia TaxID=88058 RepID=UPI000314A39D|nr:carbohydrate ABC transporter permease [Treponema primitia]
MNNSTLSLRTQPKAVVNWPITILLLIGSSIFILGVLYITLVVALKDTTQMTRVLSLPKPLVLKNFAEAWKMTDYPRKFLNTLIITVICLPFTLITNSAAAYAITRNRDKSKFFNGVYYYFISALFIPFQVLMLPLVKQASFFHLDNILGITFLYIVFGLPMNTFLYCGYVRSLPKSIEEAALIEGLNPMQIFIRIVFPIMKPIHSTVAILSIMWTWNDFLMPLLLLTKADNQTLQLAQYVFQTQFSTNYNLAFASYILVLFPVVAVYIFFQRWIIAGVTSGAVKS